MGIIATVTPGVLSYKKVAKRYVTNDEILAAVKLDIKYFTFDCSNIESFTYKMLSEINMTDVSAKVDLLWKVPWLFKFQDLVLV